MLCIKFVKILSPKIRTLST